MQLFVLVAVIVMVFLATRARYRADQGPSVPFETPPALPARDGAQLSEREALEERLELALDQRVSVIRHPQEFLDSAEFAEARHALRGDRFDRTELLRWIVNDRHWLHLAAVHVLLEDGKDDSEQAVLAGLGNYNPWSRYCALMALDRRHPAPTPWVHELLSMADMTWLGENELRVLREWVALRRQAGELPPEGDAWTEWCDGLSRPQFEIMRQLTGALGAAVASPWARALAEWERGAAINLNESTPGPDPSAPPFDMTGGSPLTVCGHLWQSAAGQNIQPAMSFPALRECVDRVEALLRERRPRPIVVVGAAKTGKTTLIRELMRRLLNDEWRVLEASPDQINAGMSMVGQLEARVSRLSEAIRPEEKVLWVVPDMTGLLWSGSVMGDAGRTIARILRQDLEGRRILLLGECTKAEWEHARLGHAWIDEVFEAVAIPVPDESQTRDLVRRWVEEISKGDEPLLDERLQTEAWDLTCQFLDESQRPGNLFGTIRQAIDDRNRERSGAPTKPLGREELLRSVSRRTGLPLELLDDERSLDLPGVESFFGERIFGQTEAVGCLVERLAMIKAGVTDPTRPLGVFFFAGPTGTGKTELAKVLASWLFGSPSRLHRVDMSELKDASALDRLLGAQQREETPASEALVDAIRREPFSVVLLDEFEKAHPEVWDLFLQLFDDGRLSDRRGKTADFRHCVVVLTSNVGTLAPTRSEVGFTSQPGRFQPDRVVAAIEDTFRPEFVNRLDRVVVFQPLDRDVMRAVLQRNIDSAFQRRGLRHRDWAVEWDEAALEFLLDAGFSERLGARPLQRAIERHLLSPLARTIAAKQVPEGDQFLFIRRDGDQLAIDFVDPDAPAEGRPQTADSRAPTDLARVALDARGTSRELGGLSARLGVLQLKIESEPWQRKRQAELEMTALPDFWESPERFEVLDVFQTRERIERMLQSSSSLYERLARSKRDTVPAHALQQLAMKLHMAGVAIDDLERHRPRESVLVVQPRLGEQPPSLGSRAFARRLVGMYQAWARQRGAQLKELKTPSADATAWAAHVQGFGSWTLLQPEGGLHVLEEPVADGQRTERHRVRVHVLAMTPHGPKESHVGTLVKRALEEPLADNRTVVRRYREQPSPLVRDAVRGWRTGRIDRVFDGAFDLISDDADSEKAESS